jgi:hypothetical protein
MVESPVDEGGSTDTLIVLHLRHDTELEEFQLLCEDLVVPAETKAALELDGETVVLGELCSQ